MPLLCNNLLYSPTLPLNYVYVLNNCSDIEEGRGIFNLSHSNYHGVIMTPENTKRAITWFTNRFVHNAKGRRFILRSHGLIEMTPDQKKKLSYRRSTNRKWEISFIDDGPQVTKLVPSFPEAAWAQGMIYLHDSNNFSFHSGFLTEDKTL